MNHRIHPSKVSGIGGLLCIVISGCHAHASWGIPGKFWIQMGQVSAICGAGIGVLTVSWASTQSALFAWIVDEDQVIRAEKSCDPEAAEQSPTVLPARRDGMINSFRSCFSIAGGPWAGVLQMVLGILGYDGELRTQGKPQNAQVRAALDSLFVGIVPLVFVTFGILMLIFPLHGARLEALLSKYKRLQDHTL